VFATSNRGTFSESVLESCLRLVVSPEPHAPECWIWRRTRGGPAPQRVQDPQTTPRAGGRTGREKTWTCPRHANLRYRRTAISERVNVAAPPKGNRDSRSTPRRFEAPHKRAQQSTVRVAIDRFPCRPIAGQNRDVVSGPGSSALVPRPPNRRRSTRRDVLSHRIPSRPVPHGAAPDR
jgi:hypothetical protein